ncbi:tetratricopeptide repeat protein [Kribbella sp. NPDC056345]|uniref:ATP-binding protein n=1 Tax=Kribbella sp. NPDC056345 TaxID=3345789 RepID=UPI0035D8F6D7
MDFPGRPQPYTRQVVDQGFGALLREHRQLARLSQEELAHRAGLSPKAISLLERAARKHPRRQTIDAIVNALELGADDHAKFLKAARRNRTAAGRGHESQLPQLTAAFTGREGELRAVIEALSNESARGPAVEIIVIDGMAGCGKTTLAVKAAHELAAQFPDGTLFIDLHGFTKGLSPADPIDVLGQALRSLGLPGQAIPETLDERSALYRSMLADRRVLVVLDNAAGAQQVVPLLPGKASSAVIVTSRVRSLGIAGARTVTLSPMETADARALFRHIAGDGDDEQEIDDLVRLCGNLPLAIEMAAARAVGEHRPLKELAKRLTDQNSSLTATESVFGLGAVLESSYRPLAEDHRLVFRLMSLSPGPRLDEYAVAAVSQLPVRTVRTILDDLVDHHLLIEDEPSVYGFHDLIRTYAFGEATAQGLEAERATAVRTFELHYLRMAARAMDVIHPAEAGRRPQVAQSALYLSALTDKEEAENWLDRETGTLLKVAASSDELAMQVIDNIMRHLQTRGRWHDAGALLPAALRAAERIGGSQHARTLLHLALFSQIRGRSADATDLYEQALPIAERSSWVVGQVMAVLGLGEIQRLTGRQATAATHYERALRLADSIDDRPGQLRALLGLGDVQCEQGDFDEAGVSYRRSLSISREIGDDFNAVNAQVGLGDIDYDRGHFQTSITKYEQALALADRVQHGPVRKYALGSLANAYRKAGRYHEAIARLEESYQYGRKIGDRVAELCDLLNLADCRLAIGQLDEAEELLTAALPLAIEQDDRDRMGRMHSSRGVLHQRRGELDLALKEFREALRFAELGDTPLDLARAHLRIATCLVDLERVSEALPSVKSAADLYTAIGSLELADALALQKRIQP